MELKSKCCNAEIATYEGGEATSYYLCTKCKKACDPEYPDTPNPTEDTEEFDKKLAEFYSTSPSCDEWYMFILHREKQVRRETCEKIADMAFDAIKDPNTERDYELVLFLL